MEGPHNAQGWSGYGPIPEKQQPTSTVWHERWQGEFSGIYALLFTNIAGNGIKGKPTPFFNLDAARWAREKLSPRDYANSSYYDLWLNAVDVFIANYGDRLNLSIQDLIRRGITTSQRVSRALAIGRRAATQPVPGCEGAPRNGLYSSKKYDPAVAGSIEAIGANAAFKVGDRVRVIRVAGDWHTRCYPYIRGAVGTVTQYYGLSEESMERFDGKYHGPYPEVTCQSRQKFYAPVYSVRFRAQDCYGSQVSDSRVFLNVDVWEPMLEAA